jgi:hypothetical protein
MPDQTFTTLYPQAGDPELLLLAKIAAGVNGRTAPEDVLIFDGTTAASRAYWTLPATPSLASSPLTVHALVGNDATTAAVVRGIWTLSSISTAYAATALALYRTNNDLVLELTGATVGTDFRRLTFANWFTNTAAGLVPVTVTWSRTAAPIVYVRGVAVTGTETTGGTAPAWTSAIVATYLVAGVRGAANLWNNRLKVTLWNVILTSSEVLSLATGPMTPSWSTDSNAVLRYTSDFSVGTDGWALDAFGTAPAMNGNVDAIGGRNDTLRLVAGTGASLWLGCYRNIGPRGRRYRITGSVYIPSGQAFGGLLILGVTNNSFIQSVVVTANTWTSFTCDYFGEDNLVGFFAFNPSTFVFVGNGTDAFYLNAITITEIGPVFRPVIQPCRIVDDAGPNQISGVLTSGVLPVTDKMDFRISGSVSTAAVAAVSLLGSPLFIDPTKIALDTIETLPTGTPTLSIGDGTTVTKYTASLVKAAAWTRETVSAYYPADVAKTGVTVNVTATGGTTCAVVIRGHRTA